MSVDPFEELRELRTRVSILESRLQNLSNSLENTFRSFNARADDVAFVLGESQCPKCFVKLNPNDHSIECNDIECPSGLRKIRP